MIKAYTLGQIQVWLDVLFAIAVWARLRGSTVITGVALGLACLIKPQLAPVLIWAVPFPADVAVRGRSPAAERVEEPQRDAQRL